MLDLSKSSAPSPSAESPSASASPRGQRLWAVLLVLDSLFVIVFGGALAAKVYQHWQAPPAPIARRRPVPAKPAPPKPAEAKAPEPAKAEPAKPKAVELPKNLPVPKPSLLNEPPRHEAAKLKGSPTTATAEAPAAPKASKAQPVEFHLSAPAAKKVELYGAFIVRGNGRKKMAKQSDGTWTLTLYLTPNTYRYHFLVDGKKALDPAASETKRGDSVVTVAAP